MRNVAKQRSWTFLHPHHLLHYCHLKIEYRWTKLIPEPTWWMKSETTKYSSNMLKLIKKEESTLIFHQWTLIREMTLPPPSKKKSLWEKWYSKNIKAINKTIENVLNPLLNSFTYLRWQIIIFFLRFSMINILNLIVIKKLSKIQRIFSFGMLFIIKIFQIQNKKDDICQITFVFPCWSNGKIEKGHGSIRRRIIKKLVWHKGCNEINDSKRFWSFRLSIKIKRNDHVKIGNL